MHLNSPSTQTLGDDDFAVLPESDILPFFLDPMVFAVEFSPVHRLQMSLTQLDRRLNTEPHLSLP